MKEGETSSAQRLREIGTERMGKSGRVGGSNRDGKVLIGKETEWGKR